MSDIFVFNPTGEMAIANGLASYMPHKTMVQFEKDLAFMPSFFASQGDIVICPELPHPNFVAQWYKLGLPNMHYVDSLIKLEQEYNYIKPWSWTPAMHHKTKNLKQHCTSDFKLSPNFSWKESNKDFFSRETTNTVQRYLFEDNQPQSPIHIVAPALSLRSLEDYNSWFANQNNAILKMPWSSSGRGIHVIDPSKDLKANEQWIRGAIKQQGYITAEPLLNKVFDFSFQFNLKQNGDIVSTGISYSLNDERQHFIGGNVNWPEQDNEINRFLSSSLLNQATIKLTRALAKTYPHTHYEGPFGIDAIVYKGDDGNLKLHPCLDINWRYNMGLVNISLTKFIHPNSVSTWKIASFGLGEWNAFIKENENLKPLNTQNGKIANGFINMTPPNEKAMFGVWMETWQKRNIIN